MGGVYFVKEQTMHTHETDHTPATPEQLAIFTGEIALAVAKAKPSSAHMQHLLRNKAATRKKIVSVLKALEIEEIAEVAITDDPYRGMRDIWKVYYRNYFAMEVGFSDVRIPAKPTEGKWRLI